MTKIKNEMLTIPMSFLPSEYSLVNMIMLCIYEVLLTQDLDNFICFSSWKMVRTLAMKKAKLLLVLYW